MDTHLGGLDSVGGPGGSAVASEVEALRGVDLPQQTVREESAADYKSNKILRRWGTGRGFYSCKQSTTAKMTMPMHVLR